jgi:hypothetical protein
MAKGRIELRNGASINYDDVEKHGNIVVYREAYTHGVRTIPASDVKEINEREWHRTPFGSCRTLTRTEVNSALDRHIGKKK